MSHSPDIEQRARILGWSIMVASALQLALFLRGISRRSYAALALPVLGLLTIASALGFWLGYTMATTRFGDASDYPPEPGAPEATG